MAVSTYLSMAPELRIPIVTFDFGLTTAARSNKGKLYFAG